MVLQVELVLPRGDADLPRGGRGQRAPAAGKRGVIPGRRVRIQPALNRVEVALRGAELRLRHHLVRLHPVQPLVEHRARGAAAMVAHSEQVHHLQHAGGALPRLHRVLRQPHRAEVRIRIIMRKIGQNPAAVRRLPPEELQRKLVGVIPRHLLGYEIVDAGPLVDLRQLPVVAEGVRVPADARCPAVEPLEGLLTNQDLPHQRLARGHVQVRLNPHAAHQLPAALLDALPDLLIQVGILVGHPLVVLRRRLRIGVVRILVHQLGGRAEGPLHHVDRLGPRPQPRRIDVRVAGQMHVCLPQRRLQRLERQLRRLQRGVEPVLVLRVQRLQVHRADGPGERCLVGCGVLRQRGQQQGGGKKLRLQVGRVGAVGGELELHVHAGHGLLVDGGQQLHRHQHLLARLGAPEQDHRLQVLAEGDPPAVEVEDLGHRPVRLRAEAEPDLRPGQVVAVQRLRNLDDAAKPHGTLRRMEELVPRRAGRHLLPAAVVERWVFSVRHVPGVVAPRAGGKQVQAVQPPDRALLLRAQVQPGILAMGHLVELGAQGEGRAEGQHQGSAQGKTGQGAHGDLL